MKSENLRAEIKFFSLEQLEEVRDFSPPKLTSSEACIGGRHTTDTIPFFEACNRQLGDNFIPRRQQKTRRSSVTKLTYK